MITNVLMSPTAFEFARRYPNSGRFHFIVDGVRDIRSMPASSTLASVLAYARRVRSPISDDGVANEVEVEFW